MLQGILVQNAPGCAFDLQPPLPAEIAQDPRHRFARSAYELRNLFLRQGDADRDLLWCEFLVKFERVLRPTQHKLGDLFRDRVGQAQRSNLAVSTFAIVRELLSYL